MSLKAYKGFDRNLKCRGFQYKEGGEYETDKAELCECGFHACEHPLDVWNFYPPCDGNRFCEVQQDGDTKKDDTETVSSKIKIGAEIGVAGIVKAHVEWVKSETVSLVGKLKSLTEKFFSSSDDGAQIGSSGDGAKIGSSGDGAQIGSSGDGAKIGSSGDGAKIKCDGENAVVACAGAKAKVNAKTGACVCLTEYDYVDGVYKCINMKAFRIDGKKYKPDTWYTLKNGNVVEVEE